MNENFMIGCNYWDSVSGTEMWKNFNPEVIDKDLAALKKCGVKYLRVFPLWRDFQPLKKLYAWQGNFGEYTVGENYEYLDNNPDAIDENQVENFREFARIADKYDMKLAVSIVTGWMSGRLFVPPALDGKNLNTDPEVLMWTEKYARALVARLRDIKNIVMWDLGNECNCLERVKTRAEAYVWTATVRNAILSSDNTRPISSGMHSLVCDNDSGVWQLCDQGELCDFVTTHPYPSAAVNGDIEPYNELRMTITPTAQSEYYAGVSKKPCIIQESGTFSPMLGNERMSADFLRVNVLSAFANNLGGFLWWCGMEHLKLKNPPYSWSMIERQLGMTDLDRNPKPAGKEMKKLSEVIYSLPQINGKRADAVCVLSRSINKQSVACASYILAKQAGFNIKIENCDTAISKSDAYILPAINRWQVTYRRTWDFLLDRVYNHGASLLVTYDGGQIVDIEKVFGFESHGVYRNNKNHVAHFASGDIKYVSANDIILKSVGAKVLAENEEGNPVFTVNDFGKGKVDFLGFSPENIATETCCGFDPENSEEFYRIYKEFGKNIAESYDVKCDNPYIGITELDSDSGKIFCAINYSEKQQKFDVENKDDFKILYGALGDVPPCDGVILQKK